MNTYNSEWRLVGGPDPGSVPAPLGILPRKIADLAERPASQQVITWLLFWPLLTLIARQSVYIDGPARTAEAFQHGAAMAGARGAHPQLYVYVFILFAFVVAGHRQVWAALKSNPLIVAMLALAVCSASWSDSPVITLQMCAQVGLCTLFACYLSTRFTSERLMDLLIFMGVVSAVLSVIFVFALPGYGIFQGYEGGAWQGICPHKNTFGVSMAFLLSPVFFTNSYGRTRKWLYSALLLFLIYKSQSRGAWFDAAGMLLFVGWLKLIRRVRPIESALIVVITGGVGLVVIALGVHFWPLLAASMGKSTNMTGRTEIYTEVWHSIMKHPVLGYGLGGFWYPGSLESQRVGLALGWPNIGYSESGILELALQIGFLGVALVLAMIAKATVQGVHLLRSLQYTPRVGWFLTVLFLAALTNLEAGWLLTSNTLDWVLIVVSCVGMNDEILRTRVS
jgi:exopolysaccharide production protein ExoQ